MGGYEERKVFDPNGAVVPIFHGVWSVSSRGRIAASRPMNTTGSAGVLAGTSTGVNVVAALRVAERLGSDATVVTLAVDSGLRYLSTDVFRGA